MSGHFTDPGHQNSKPRPRATVLKSVFLPSESKEGVGAAFVGTLTYCGAFAAFVIFLWD
jgi:hypothetical protein